MSDIPTFKIYGEDSPIIKNIIQAKLPLRKWSDLTKDEKRTAFQYIDNSGWIKDYDDQIINSIEDLNYNFLRVCPGKHLHRIKPEPSNNSPRYGNEYERKKSARKDFEEIFINESNDAIFLRMISVFISGYIDPYSYKNAKGSEELQERKSYK